MDSAAILSGVFFLIFLVPALFVFAANKIFCGEDPNVARHRKFEADEAKKKQNMNNEETPLIPTVSPTTSGSDVEECHNTPTNIPSDFERLTGAEFKGAVGQGVKDQDETEIIKNENRKRIEEEEAMFGKASAITAPYFTEHTPIASVPSKTNSQKYVGMLWKSFAVFLFLALIAPSGAIRGDWSPAERWLVKGVGYFSFWLVWVGLYSLFFASRYAAYADKSRLFSLFQSPKAKKITVVSVGVIVVICIASFLRYEHTTDAQWIYTYDRWTGSMTRASKGNVPVSHTVGGTPYYTPK